jgi:hypothetical protein
MRDAAAYTVGVLGVAWAIMIQRTAFALLRMRSWHGWVLLAIAIGITAWCAWCAAWLLATD